MSDTFDTAPALDDGLSDLHAGLPSAAVTTQVAWPTMSTDAAQVIERAWDHLTVERAVDENMAITNIGSYTGRERQLADYYVDRLGALGLDAHRQDLDEESSNAIVTLGRQDEGTLLALVAPTDTHFTGDMADDGPQWGSRNRRDNTLPAERVGDTILGVGSDNPKAMCTAILLALEALTVAGFEPRGGVVGAFAACGAPARTPEGSQREMKSLGIGVTHAVSHGLTPDYAVYHKPGYQVSWEDSALNQYEITVEGHPTYMRNGTYPYRVVDTICEIAARFNAWAESYNRRQVGVFRGRAAMNVIQVGRPDKPNWSSGVGKVYADVRTAPSAPPAMGRWIMQSVMDKVIGAYPHTSISWRQVVYMPGGTTSPTNWIVQSGIRAALSVDGRRDDTYRMPSAGQTEMGYLQRLGIPTIKLAAYPPGVVNHPERPADINEFTLSAAYAPHIVKAAKVLVYTAVDTLSRSRDELMSAD